MREIKFRAWDIKNKKWLQIGQSLLGYLVAWRSDDKFEILGRGNYKIMQYTGLKDKNGKEIYEGDIVRIPLNIKEYFDCKVEFNDGCFDVVQDRFRNYLKVYVANRGIKVIGNVWEDGELLDIK